jgi:hypothetical protein
MQWTTTALSQVVLKINALNMKVEHYKKNQSNYTYRDTDVLHWYAQGKTEIFKDEDRKYIIIRKNECLILSCCKWG